MESDTSDHGSTTTSLEGDILINTESLGRPPKDHDDDGSHPSEFDTLDEPILTTINRDLKIVGQKLYYTLIPDTGTLAQKTTLLKEWDLWIPLFFCTYLALIIQELTPKPSGYEFTETFCLIWIGAGFLTYNAVFTQAVPLSIFQCVCVIGYCLGPIVGVGTILGVLNLIGYGIERIYLRAFLIALSVGWSSFCCISQLSTPTPTEKKFVVFVPLVIYYVTVGIFLLYQL